MAVLRRLVPSALLTLLLLSSCSRPLGTELFIKSSKAADGVYIFDIPLEDSLSTYDFWIYSRTGDEVIKNLQINAMWLSPSGESLNEVVYMREVKPSGSVELYRSDMVPAETGEWKLSLRPVDAPESLYGLGIVCKENNGTR